MTLPFHILVIKVSTMVAVHSASDSFQAPLSLLVWFTVLPWFSGCCFGALNDFHLTLSSFRWHWLAPSFSCGTSHVTPTDHPEFSDFILVPRGVSVGRACIFGSLACSITFMRSVSFHSDGSTSIFGDTRKVTLMSEILARPSLRKEHQRKPDDKKIAPAKQRGI